MSYMEMNKQYKIMEMKYGNPIHQFFGVEPISFRSLNLKPSLNEPLATELVPTSPLIAVSDQELKALVSPVSLSASWLTVREG